MPASRVQTLATVLSSHTIASGMRAYKLKMVVNGSKPKITRTIAIPETASFRDLHNVIQMVLGWYDQHLHSFDLGGREFGNPELDIEDDSTVPLSQFEGEKIHYTYDFGDCWAVTISWLKTIENYGKDTPSLLKWTENSLTDDCGGLWGYYHYLESVADPSSEDHEWAKEILADIEFDEQGAQNMLDTYRIKGVVENNSIYITTDAQMAIVCALACMTDEPLVFDTQNLTPLAIKDGPKRKSKRKSKKEGSMEDIPCVSSSEIELEPDRYIPLAGPLSERMPAILSGFEDLYQETDWSDIEGESDKDKILEFIGENDLSDEFMDYLMESMTDYSLSWADENNISYGMDHIAAGIFEDVISFFEDNSVDMDDSQAIGKALMDYFRQG